LLLFNAQSTLLQCSTVIGVAVLLALLGRFLPKLRAALLRPFFLSREVIHALMIEQAEFCGFYVRQKYNFVLCCPKAVCRPSPSSVVPSFFCFEDATDRIFLALQVSGERRETSARLNTVA
jgi:hypothetical protein